MWRIPTQAQVDEKASGKLPVKTVHMGSAQPAPSVPLAEVSTNLTRRAARRASFRLARQAQARRKGVLIVLAAVTTATIPLAVLSVMHWWICVTGAVLTAGWAIFSRIEALRMTRQLDAIIADTQLGDAEETVAVALPEKADPKTRDLPAGAVMGPNGDIQQSLWDPITVVGGSYISPAKAARTIRTIQLPPAKQVPVTAGDTDGTEESSARIAI
ncbi:MAG: hypothetical protein LBN10_06460 [Propionibacteriaceae bacterium]|jgi:hypothetical protein|nr:hypothetical protein [Propionibacteriaceae bacterium]